MVEGLKTIKVFFLSNSNFPIQNWNCVWQQILSVASLKWLTPLVDFCGNVCPSSNPRGPSCVCQHALSEEKQCRTRVTTRLTSSPTERALFFRQTRHCGVDGEDFGSLPRPWDRISRSKCLRSTISHHSNFYINEIFIFFKDILKWFFFLFLLCCSHACPVTMRAVLRGSHWASAPAAWKPNPVLILMALWREYTLI